MLHECLLDMVGALYVATPSDHSYVFQSACWGEPEQAPHLRGKRVETVGWSMHKRSW